MNQFTEYKEDALGQLGILREFYDMDSDDDLDAGILVTSGREPSYFSEGI